MMVPARLLFRVPVCLVSILLTVFLGFADAHAASERGIVTGTVADPDGRPVADAQVLLTQAASISARARTDAEGHFQFADVAAGIYDVRVVVEGFRAEPQTIRAEGAKPAEVTIRLHLSAVSESVVVSASQVDVPLSLVGESASVVSHADIEARQLETVSDVLRLVPGIEVAQNGGRGSVTSLFARGGESDYTLVLVNGVRVNAFGGGFDFSQLASSSNIDRIEVVRGPGSALFGSDAIGAVVSIITRQGGRPGADVILEGGSLGTARMAASTSGSKGAWSWGGSAERVTSNGFTGIAPATGERVSNDDYKASQVTGTATWRAASGAQVAMNGAWNRSDRGFPGAFGSNPIGAFYGVDRFSRGLTETRETGLSVKTPLAGGRVQQHAQVSWFDLTSDFKSTYGLSASGTRRIDARAQTDVTVTSSTRISAGVDLQHERANSDFITGTVNTPVPIVRNLVGVFAEARHQHGARLTVTAGVRGETVERSALEGSPNPYVPRPPFAADTDHAVNPKASISYLVYAGKSAWMRARASAGTGMRAPDALEIAFTDNPHLKPERSRSGEAGVEAGLLGGLAVVNATYFSNSYDDLIVAVGPAIHDSSKYMTDNIANAQSKGIELSSRLRTRWGLEAQVAYTWLDTAILAVDRAGVAPPPFHVGDALLRRPRHAGSFDIVFRRGRLTAYSEMSARSRAFDVEPSYGAFGGLYWNPGYATVRCGGAFRVTRAVAITARVDNLFNRYYEETYGFPALGRTLMAGVRVAAGR